MRIRIPVFLVVFSLLAAVLLSSCSAQGGNPADGSDRSAVSSAGAGSDVTTAGTTVPAGPSVSLRVAGEDGNAVSGADVLLVSSSLDLEIRAVTADDGTASPDGITEGTWFVRVSKDGCRTSETLVDMTDGANSVDITLPAADKLPQYLLSYTYQTSADGPSLIGLAGSADGVTFTAFPGWKTIEGEGGGVTVLDGYLCVYAKNTVVRYDLDTGVWEAPQPYCVYSEAGLQNGEQDFFGALMRDVRFFEDPAEGVVAVGGDMDLRFDYSDFFEESLAQKLISLAGWQTPLADAGGLLLLRPANTKLTGGIVDDLTDRDASFVLLPAPDGGRYLLTTTADGLRILHGAALGGEFTPTEVLPDSYMYKGDIAGVAGYYDAQNGYTLYGVRDASEKQLYRAVLASFDVPFDVEKGLVPVDMSFLDPAAVSFSNPVLWDTSKMDAERVSDTAALPNDDLKLDLGGEGYLLFPMTGAEMGALYYNSMQEGGTYTANITPDMTLVSACKAYTPSAFAVSAKAPAGTNIVSAGLVYAWSPSGTMPGGFTFTVSEGTWKLSALVPETLSGLVAGSKIVSNETLLEGAFTGDPADAVLSVFFRDGHHILLIDGEIVGEYDTPADLGLLHAGYVGLIATSGTEGDGATFSYEEPYLMVR